MSHNFGLETKTRVDDYDMIGVQRKGLKGIIGQSDWKLTFFERKWCKNTKKMVGWSGLYNGNEQAQRCRGHPGLLHLQCTHQKIFNTTLI